MRAFEEIAFEYEEMFGQQPPILTTLDVENEDYKRELEKAIERQEPITRDYLADIFMVNEEVVY